MIKGWIQEEDITIVNIYAPNIGAPQYLRQTLTDIKEEIDSNTIIVGDFNTPLKPMDRSSKQKINKGTQVLHDTLDEVDLIDIIRTFHPNSEEYTFFSSACGTFSKIDHILGHKWNNWQKINFQNIQAAHTTQCQKNNPIKKWEKGLNRHFSKEDMQIANKYMKDAQHGLLLGKCKSKLQWDITSHWSEWPSLSKKKMIKIQ